MFKKQRQSLRAISELAGYDRKTIGQYLIAEDIVPVYGPRPPSASKLDAFRPYLEKRMKVWNAKVLSRDSAEELQRRIHNSERWPASAACSSAGGCSMALRDCARPAGASGLGPPGLRSGARAAAQVQAICDHRFFRPNPPTRPPKRCARTSPARLGDYGLSSDMPCYEQTNRRLRKYCFKERVCVFSGKICATASGPS